MRRFSSGLWGHPFQRQLGAIPIALGLLGTVSAQIPAGAYWTAPDPRISGAAILAVVPDSEQQAKQSLRLLSQIAQQVAPAEVVVFDDRLRAQKSRVAIRLGGMAARAEIERFADLEGGGLAVLVGEDQRILLAGPIDLDLIEEMQDLRSGRLDPVERRASVLQATMSGEAATSTRERTLHWTAHAARFARELRELKGEGALQTLFDRSWQALDERPYGRLRYLGGVVGSMPAVVASGPVRREVQRLQRQSPRSPLVQFTAFELAVRAGRFADARSAGFAWLETQKGLPGRVELLLDVIDDVAGAADALPRLSDQAVRIGLHSTPDDRRLLMRSFDQRRWLDEDMPGARAAARRVIAVCHQDAQALNSFAWKLLTTEGYAGHFDDIALEAAQAMESDSEWRTSWRLDTYALARFVNGDVDGAVAFQEAALETCGAGARARYQARLDRYRAARDR